MADYGPSGALFTGDHVMGWSTSVIVPPDGDMADYMASLDKLRQRDDRIFYPAHGPPVEKPRQYVRSLIGHRMQRERQILALVSERPRPIPDIVAKVITMGSPFSGSPYDNNAWRIYHLIAGHSVEEPVPSLFTFNLRDARVGGLAGVSVEELAAYASVSTRTEGSTESDAIARRERPRAVHAARRPCPRLMTVAPSELRATAVTGRRVRTVLVRVSIAACMWPSRVR